MSMIVVERVVVADLKAGDTVWDSGIWRTVDVTEFDHICPEVIFEDGESWIFDKHTGYDADNPELVYGPGGWTVSGVYSGNATDAEVLEASVAHANRSPIDGLAADLLALMEEASELRYDDETEQSS